MPRWVRSSLAGLAILASIRLAYAEPLLFDVAQAVAVDDPRTGEPGVSCLLTDESTRRFRLFTLQNVGRAMQLRVNGKEYWRPVIRDPLLSGWVMIFGKLSEQDARDLAARLSAGAKLEIEAVAN